MALPLNTAVDNLYGLMYLRRWGFSLENVSVFLCGLPCFPAWQWNWNERRGSCFLRMTSSRDRIMYSSVSVKEIFSSLLTHFSSICLLLSENDLPNSRYCCINVWKWASKKRKVNQCHCCSRVVLRQQWETRSRGCHAPLSCRWFFFTILLQPWMKKERECITYWVPFCLEIPRLQSSVTDDDKLPKSLFTSFPMTE